MCQICQNTSYTVLHCWHRFDHAYTKKEILEALATLGIINSANPSFYADSLATFHMTNDSSKIFKISFYSGKYVIFVDNGSCLPISHIGSTK